MQCLAILLTLGFYLSYTPFLQVSKSLSRKEEEGEKKNGKKGSYFLPFHAQFPQERHKLIRKFDKCPLFPFSQFEGESLYSVQKWIRIAVGFSFRLLQYCPLIFNFKSWLGENW